jgi:hypothetical protein
MKMDLEEMERRARTGLICFRIGLLWQAVVNAVTNFRVP